MLLDVLLSDYLGTTRLIDMEPLDKGLLGAGLVDEPLCPSFYLTSASDGHQNSLVWIQTVDVPVKKYSKRLCTLFQDSIDLFYEYAQMFWNFVHRDIDKTLCFNIKFKIRFE